MPKYALKEVENLPTKRPHNTLVYEPQKYNDSDFTHDNHKRQTYDDSHFLTPNATHKKFKISEESPVLFPDASQYMQKPKKEKESPQLAEQYPPTHHQQIHNPMQYEIFEPEPKQFEEAEPAIQEVQNSSYVFSLLTSGVSVVTNTLSWIWRSPTTTDTNTELDITAHGEAEEEVKAEKVDITLHKVQQSTGRMSRLGELTREINR